MGINSFPMATINLINGSARTLKAGDPVKLHATKLKSFDFAELGAIVIGTLASQTNRGSYGVINLLGSSVPTEITQAQINAIIAQIPTPSVELTSEQIADIVSQVPSTDISMKVDKITNYSLVANTEISKIHSNTSDHSNANDHAPESDNQDLSTLQPKESGKGLSATDLTAGLKTSYDGAVTHAGSAHAPAGATIGADWNTNLANIPTSFAPAAHNQDASTINAGTLDGDRLPAISATKKGAVPLTGSPSGKFLKDDNTWAAPTASVAITEVEIDCGATPLLETIIAVTNAGITAASKIIGGLAYKAPTGKDLDELDMDALDLKFEPLSGSFNVHIKGLEGYISDKFIIWYLFA